MAQISIKIPQIGEGLQEARIVAFLKQPGDTVRRDEAIYQMETDKAVMDVESPVAGTISQWLAKVDDVVAIGADVLVMEVVGEGEVAPEPAPAPAAATEASSGFADLVVPQIGEGLQEARIVAFLKQPGDLVRRDEAVYQMETDKAVMDVESPFEGELLEWVASVDEVLPIGSIVGRIRSQGAVAPMPTATEVTATAISKATEASVQARPVAQGERRRDVPPRTRAYAKAKGLTNDQIELIHAAGSKLMPEDVDAFLSGGALSSGTVLSGGSGRSYQDSALAPKQRILASRLMRGNQLVVPGMMSVCVNWEPLEALRKKQAESGSSFKPSAFTYVAYCVAQAAKDHAIARSTLVGDSMVRTYEHLYLGIAVARPGDELVVAVVDRADALEFKEFASTTRTQIELARDGKDQAHEAVTLSITNMSGHGIRDAMAVVVPPGVITVFVGEPFWGVSNDEAAPRFMRCANVGVTIDHRLINGVGGANFLNAVKANIEGVAGLIGG